MKVCPEDYPQIKYRLVTGNGSQVFYGWESVQRQINYYRTNPTFKDCERFQPKYIIKITEEYMEIPTE